MLDRFVAAEGEPEVIQFSGGEPSIHPQIVTFLEMARERGIGTVMLNTNGVRIARDRAFAEEVARVGPRRYLQLDGVDRETHPTMRGRDLRRDKERALEACAELGIGVTLVAALERGVNEHAAGAVLRLGVSNPAVNSVVFQPGHPPRSPPRVRPDEPPHERLRDGVAPKQAPEWLRVTDPVPKVTATRID